MLNQSPSVPAEQVRPYTFSQKNGVIALMDRGGSNVEKLTQQMPGVVKLLVTADSNNPDCKIRKRHAELHIPYVAFDLPGYEKKRGVERGDYLAAVLHGPEAKFKGVEDYTGVLQVRADACFELDYLIAEACENLDISLNAPMIALGMMQLLSAEFVQKNFVLNVHPGDLTKYAVDNKTRGKRIIVGDAWVPSARALAAGHEMLYSSLHLMTADMDAGPVFMRGYPLPVNYNRLESIVDLKDPEQLKEVAKKAQTVLKEIGDYVIVGATLRDLFAGRWGRMDDGTLAYRRFKEWYRVPAGIVAQDHAKSDVQSPFHIPNEVLHDYAGFFNGSAGLVKQDVTFARAAADFLSRTSQERPSLPLRS